MEQFRLASFQESTAAHSQGGTVHELKCWPKFYQAIADGLKRHDLRRNTDRNFAVGDCLRLREFDPDSQSYTDREQYVRITYITSAEEPCALSEAALDNEFCILSIALATKL